MSSPTTRTLELLRRNGYEAAIVERFNHYSKTRHDLFGFADILAMGHGFILGVQTTSASNTSSRRAKILAEPRAKAFLENKGRIFIHGWRKKKKKKGGKAMVWHCNETEILQDDFASTPEREGKL